MKLTYNNTALGLLDKDVTPFSFRIVDDGGLTDMPYKTKFGLSVVREWPKAIPLFKKRIQYVSEPFYKAFEAAREKLHAVIDKEPIHESGTLIYKDDGGKSHNTIFYEIVTEGAGDNWNIHGAIFIFSKGSHMDKPVLGLYAQRFRDGSTKEYIGAPGIKNGTTCMSVMADILGMLLFLKYCDTEIKVVKGNKRETHIGIKYVNDTNRDIEVLDSTWFTTIVRS